MVTKLTVKATRIESLRIIGVSIHDIYFAISIYQLKKERGTLSSMPNDDMRDPTE